MGADRNDKEGFALRHMVVLTVIATPLIYSIMMAVLILLFDVSIHYLITAILIYGIGFIGGGLALPAVLRRICRLDQAEIRRALRAARTKWMEESGARYGWALLRHSLKFQWQRVTVPDGSSRAWLVWILILVYSAPCGYIVVGIISILTAPIVLGSG